MAPLHGGIRDDGCRFWLWIALVSGDISGKKLFHLSKGLEQNLTLFQLCSIPTIIWGLIYGNFFGFEFSFQLLSAQDDVNQILVLSVIFGYIQIMFGLALKFYILWKKKDQKLAAMFQAGSWIVF